MEVKFVVGSPLDLVATDQEMVRGKNSSRSGKFPGNFFLGQGKLSF